MYDNARSYVADDVITWLDRFGNQNFLSPDLNHTFSVLYLFAEAINGSEKKDDSEKTKEDTDQTKETPKPKPRLRQNVHKRLAKKSSTLQPAYKMQKFCVYILCEHDEVCESHLLARDNKRIFGNLSWIQISKYHKNSIKRPGIYSNQYI